MFSNYSSNYSYIHPFCPPSGFYSIYYPYQVDTSYCPLIPYQYIPSFYHTSHYYSNWYHNFALSSLRQKNIQVLENTFQHVYFAAYTQGMTAEKANSLTNCIQQSMLLSHYQLKNNITSLFTDSPFSNWKDQNGYNFFERILVQKNHSLIADVDFNTIYTSQGQNGLHAAISHENFADLSTLAQTLPQQAFLQTNKKNYTVLEETVYIHSNEKAALCLLQNEPNLSKFVFKKYQPRFINHIVRYDYDKIFAHFSNVMNLFDSKEIQRNYFLLAEDANSTKVAQFLYEKITSKLLASITIKNKLFLKEFLYQAAGKHARYFIQNFTKGSHSQKIYPIFLEFWKIFVQFQPCWIADQKIEHAITLAIEEGKYATSSVSLLTQCIQKGAHPVIIETGYIKHSITAVFHNNMVFICNRGAGLQKINNVKRYIRVAEYTSANITEEAIEKLIEAGRIEKEQESFNYIYSNFFTKIKAISNLRLEETILRACPMRPQSNSNCTVTSLKVAILAILISRYNAKTISEQSIRQCYKIYKDFSTWTKIQAINMFVKNIGASAV